MMKTTKFLITMAFCLSAGALIGILYAPHKGTVTRRKIYRKGNHVKHNMENMFRNIADRYENTADRFSKGLKQIRFLHN